MTLCAIIPVHQPHLAPREALSLRACYEKLEAYDCYLVFPKNMNVDAYTAIHKRLIMQPVPPSWLSSIENYNKMKVSRAFYELFARYDHLLTYELDSYIFNSDFESSAAFKFDYIGAPFFEGYWDAAPDASFIAGCNSGFSIRNIRSCIKVLSSMEKYRPHWLFYKLFLSWSFRWSSNINKLTKYKYDLYVSGQLGFHFSNMHINEDLVWSQLVPALFPWFSVADPVHAMKFSFEYNPARLFELNHHQYPSGCHAWYKNPDFWRNHSDFYES